MKDKRKPVSIYLKPSIYARLKATIPSELSLSEYVANIIEEWFNA